MEYEAHYKELAAWLSPNRREILEQLITAQSAENEGHFDEWINAADELCKCAAREIGYAETADFDDREAGE